MMWKYVVHINVMIEIHQFSSFFILSQLFNIFPKLTLLLLLA